MMISVARRSIVRPPMNEIPQLRRHQKRDKMHGVFEYRSPRDLVDRDFSWSKRRAAARHATRRLAFDRISRAGRPRLLGDVRGDRRGRAIDDVALPSCYLVQ
jgi:hypothetical protein